jgi:hypothetical protein
MNLSGCYLAEAPVAQRRWGILYTFCTKIIAFTLNADRVRLRIATLRARKLTMFAAVPYNGWDAPAALNAGVAQLVEHLICNQRVGGSSPSASSII